MWPPRTRSRCTRHLTKQDRKLLSSLLLLQLLQMVPVKTMVLTILDVKLQLKELVGTIISMGRMVIMARSLRAVRTTQAMAHLSWTYLFVLVRMDKNAPFREVNNKLKHNKLTMAPKTRLRLLRMLGKQLNLTKRAEMEMELSLWTTLPKEEFH